MSYRVTVTRRGDEGVVPISPDELTKVVADDRLWNIVPPSNDYQRWQLVRTEKGRAWQLTLEAGELATSSPENDQLLRLQELAKLLGARVIGEDGADLTNARVTESWAK